MKVLVKSLAVIACVFVFISCGNKNASTKINSDNLENAKNRDVEIKNGAALISFDRDTHDFGTVTEGEIIETTFKVTNSGKTDLIITDAQVTCGCTVPVWPKAPIKPGQSEEIQVKFDTRGKTNRQQKNITLITNTEAGREILTLKGMVTPKA